VVRVNITPPRELKGCSKGVGEQFEKVNNVFFNGRGERAAPTRGGIGGGSSAKVGGGVREKNNDRPSGGTRPRKPSKLKGMGGLLQVGKREGGVGEKPIDTP